MSKPKSKFRGIPYIWRYSKWDDARKGDCAYKDNISAEHTQIYRKTYHVERYVFAGWKGAGKCDRNMQNVNIVRSELLA